MVQNSTTQDATCACRVCFFVNKGTDNYLNATYVDIISAGGSIANQNWPIFGKRINRMTTLFKFGS